MLKFLVVVVIVALVVYALVRIIDRRTRAIPPLSSNPDDDPDFLRDLDFRRWQQQRHTESDSDDPADD